MNKTNKTVIQRVLDINPRGYEVTLKSAKGKSYNVPFRKGLNIKPFINDLRAKREVDAEVMISTNRNNKTVWKVTQFIHTTLAEEFGSLEEQKREYEELGGDY